VNARDLIDLWEKYNIKGEYCTTPVCLQQLLEDFPETIEKIKRLKISVTRYGGVGHVLYGPVGRLRNIPGIREMNREERIRAEWLYETHTLVPDWHFEDGKVVLSNPGVGKPITLDEMEEYNIPKKEMWLYGGTLAIQKILGVTPMGFFEARFKCIGKDEQASTFPITPVKRALGMEYPISYNPGCPLSPPITRGGIEGLKWMAENMPRNEPLYFWTVGGEEVIRFLLDNPDEFKIVWPDPEAWQWRPENSPLEFYRRTYGVQSVKEVLEMECPVKKILEMIPSEERRAGGKLRERGTAESWKSRLMGLEEMMEELPEFMQPIFTDIKKLPSYLLQKERVVTKRQVLDAADYLMVHGPRSWLTHHGEVQGGPPDYVKAEDENFSLAEAFQAFARSLDYYVKNRTLPEKVVLKEILGPIDYPMYELKDELKMDPWKNREEWWPFELDREYFPDPQIVASQGIGSISVLVNDSFVLGAVCQAAQQMDKNGHIPGVIPILIPRTERRDIALPRQVGEPAIRHANANPAEILYAMAQELRLINIHGMPGPVVMRGILIIQYQRSHLIAPSTTVVPSHYRFRLMDGAFIWREMVTKWLINAAWTYKP